jgi:ribosomal protein S18 acetylase RimI-like enzyme
MLAESPWAFESSSGDDVALDPAHLQTILSEEQNAIVAIEIEVETDLTAKHGGQNDAWQIVALAGIFRMKGPKFAHRARIWGVYVEPEHRCRGLGQEVMRSAIELAESWAGVDFIDLGVSANSPEARHLYDRLGFKEWGREPDATEHEGRRYDEIYMALRIERGASS